MSLFFQQVVFSVVDLPVSYTLDFPLHTHFLSYSIFLLSCLFTCPRWDVVCNSAHTVYFLALPECIFKSVFSLWRRLFFLIWLYDFSSLRKLREETTTDTNFWDAACLKEQMSCFEEKPKKSGREVILIENGVWGKWGEKRIIYNPKLLRFMREFLRKCRPFKMLGSLKLHLETQIC